MPSSQEKPEHIFQAVGLSEPVKAGAHVTDCPACLLDTWEPVFREAGAAAERERMVEEMAKMKMIAMNQGQFQAGWDSALEEIFTRMGLEEDHGR